MRIARRVALSQTATIGGTAGSGDAEPDGHLTELSRGPRRDCLSSEPLFREVVAVLA
jgi:hypothetical protein